MIWETGDLYSELLLQEKTAPSFENYYDVEFRQGFDMLSHQHQRLELMYVSKGKCTVTIDGEEHPLTRGEFILINGRIPHRLLIEPGKVCRIINLEFLFRIDPRTPCCVKDLWRTSLEVQRLLSSSRDFFLLSDAGNLYPTLQNLIQELEANAPGKDFLLSLHIVELLLKIARIYCESETAGYRPANLYVSKSLDFMRSHYSRDLSVAEIAAAVNLSPRYFQKIFKQVTGTTPMDYLTKLRMEKAKLLLQKTELPLAELCLLVGINSRQYFSYLFKKYTGLTPQEFKKAATAARTSRSFSCRDLSSEPHQSS